MKPGLLCVLGTALLLGACATAVDTGAGDNLLGPPTGPGDAAAEAPHPPGLDGSPVLDTGPSDDSSSGDDSTPPPPDSGPPPPDAGPPDVGPPDVVVPEGGIVSCDANNPIYAVEYVIAVQHGAPNCFQGCSPTQCCYLAL